MRRQAGAALEELGEIGWVLEAEFAREGFGRCGDVVKAPTGLPGQPLMHDLERRESVLGPREPIEALAGQAEGAGVALERPAIEIVLLDQQEKAGEQSLMAAPPRPFRTTALGAGLRQTPHDSARKPQRNRRGPTAWRREFGRKRAHQRVDS